MAIGGFWFGNLDLIESTIKETPLFSLEMYRTISAHISSSIYISSSGNGSIINSSDEIIFANGGDRNSTNNREAKVEGVKFVYGVGGSNKKNSSSDILKAWKE